MAAARGVPCGGLFFPDRLPAATAASAAAAKSSNSKNAGMIHLPLRQRSLRLRCCICMPPAGGLGCSDHFSFYSESVGYSIRLPGIPFFCIHAVSPYPPIIKKEEEDSHDTWKSSSSFAAAPVGRTPASVCLSKPDGRTFCCGGPFLRIRFSDYALTALAISHRAVKAAGSWIAVSESILRFMSTPAIFRPCMKVE